MVGNKFTPAIANAPGLVWKPHRHGWEARWQARTALIKRGFTPKSKRLWVGETPSDEDAAAVSKACQALQAAMLEFSKCT